MTTLPTNPSLAETVDTLSNGPDVARQAVFETLRCNREVWNPAVNAFDTMGALAYSARSGPLAGLPITIKDQIAVEGMPWSLGLDTVPRGVATETAPLVRRLLRAGAVVTGKTTLPPYAMDFQTFNARVGRTNNPVDPEVTAGGSSGGGAAAVATGMSLLDIGADLGGSLRIPASFCGVASLVPTEGILPGEGMLTQGRTLAHFARMGPLAQRVEDLAFIWPHLCGETALDPETSVLQPRVVLWDATDTPLIDAATQAIWSEVSARLAQADLDVQTSLMADLLSDEVRRIYGEVMGHETGALMPAPIRWLARWAGRDAARRSPEFLRHVHAGYRRRTRHYQSNLDALARHRADARARWAEVDALVLPVTAVGAFRHRVPERDRGGIRDYRAPFETPAGPLSYLAAMTAFTVPISALGWPVVTVPVGRDMHGLPVGVQVVGKPGGEAALLSLAAMLSALLRVPA